jgi:hypothetical protein
MLWASLPGLTANSHGTPEPERGNDDVVDETRENLSRFRTEVQGLIPVAERAVEVTARAPLSPGLEISQIWTSVNRWS